MSHGTDFYLQMDIMLMAQLGRAKEMKQVILSEVEF